MSEMIPEYNVCYHCGRNLPAHEVLTKEQRRERYCPILWSRLHRDVRIDQYDSGYWIVLNGERLGYSSKNKAREAIDKHLK